MGKGRTVLTVTDEGRALGTPTLSLIVAMAGGGVDSTEIQRQGDGTGLVVLYSDQLRMDVRVELKPNGQPGAILDMALRDRYATQTFAMLENVQADYGDVRRAIKKLEHVLEGRDPEIEDAIRLVRLLDLPMNVDGTDGYDILISGQGGGVLRAEGGNDDIFLTGPGRIEGGAGVDTLHLAFFRDLFGKKAAAVIDLKKGVMKLPGGEKTKLAGLERVEGGAERDVIRGAGRSETFEGAGGKDLLAGRGGADLLLGGGGADRILGGGGADSIFGQAGADVLRGGAGGDEISGGGGRDRIFGDGGSDVLAGVGGADRIEGGGGDDTLNGGAGRDRLWGDAGDDTVIGVGGNDRLFGGKGADRLLGGEGDDLLRGGGGGDTLSGEAGEDALFGGRGGDFLDGGEGADRLSGDGGADRLTGGADDDFLYGGGGDDQAAGGDGDDVIEGGAGDDTLAGNGGDDTLIGGGGDDTLIGNDGDDVLIAGAGVDILRGDGGATPGADEFRLDPSGKGVDVIKDFHAGEDSWGVEGLTLDDLKIVFSGEGFAVERASDGLRLALFERSAQLDESQDLIDGFILL